jgi:NADH:ubiquinone reductase (H+-translocating)
MNMPGSKKKVLILGGGFAGMYTAKHLERLLQPEEAEISLVNLENYSVYQPMLPEVISGSIGLTDVVSPIRRICPRSHLIMRDLEEIDLARKVVTVSPGFRPRRLELPYDYLVVALGGTTSFYGMPGMLENAKPFRNLADAVALRNHLIHALEEADVETDAALRSKLLTFVVAGGGFSGVEVMAELNDFVNSVKKNYSRIRKEKVRCVLVHSGDRILPEMTQDLALFAQRILARRGVEIVLKDRLAAATSEKAIFKSGVEVPTKTIVSTVPSTVAPVLQKLDCAKDKGRLLVNSFLEVNGYEGTVWALGDCSSAKTKAGNPVPPTAQHAIREAKTVAHNITAAIRGGARWEFAFEGLGKLGSLGHFSAVAEILGFRISGFPAWLLWRGIYLSKFPGFSQKVRIGLDWLTALLFPPDLVQLKMLRESDIRRQHFEPGEVVFNQGDFGDSVYVIEKGTCEVIREQDGQRRHLADLGGGDYFGEMAVLADVSRNATIRATTPLDVLLIPKDDFSTLKNAVPAFGDVFKQLAKARSAEDIKSETAPKEN